MLVEDDAGDDVLMAAEWTADADTVAFTDRAVWFGVLAVDLDLPAFAGALCFRARLEETGDVQPDVQSNGVAHMRISIFAFAFSALTNNSVSACRFCSVRYCSICVFASSSGTTRESCLSATLMM
jgi:hypothetical protein